MCVVALRVVTAPLDPTDALAAVPAAGNRRAEPMPATLEFFYGPMDCGKSTLALQIDHNQSRQGRRGIIITRHDRSASPRVTSRIGLARDALEFTDDMDARAVVRDVWARGERVDYLIVDEAQFLRPEQVEQLADLVDESHVDVYAFGLATDFRSHLFPGAQRLFELADRATPVQVDVLCWCGRQARFNGRVQAGAIVRAGDTVVVADIEDDTEDLRYQVLCRRHFRAGKLRADDPGPGQLTIS